MGRSPRWILLLLFVILNSIVCFHPSTTTAEMECFIYGQFLGRMEDVGKIWRWAPTLHLKVIRTERLRTPEGEFTMEMERLKQ